MGASSVFHAHFALATVICLSHITVAAADYLVINAASAEPEAGTIVAADTPLHIADGGMMVLLGPDGVTVTLVGPHDGVAPAAAAAPEDAGLVDALAVLWRDDEGTQVLGAIRAGDTDQPSDPWLIDSRGQGDQCARSANDIYLWRPRSEAREQLSIRDAAGQRQRVTWPRGEATLAWPETVAVEDGGSYRLRIGTASITTQVTLHVMPEGVSNDIEKALWLAEQGCREQARRLLGALR